MKSIIALLCFCTLYGISFSQDTYTFTCRLPGYQSTEKYTGLMVRSPGGSGFIRLRGTTATSSGNLYDLEWGPYFAGDELKTDYAEQRMHYPFSSDSFLCIKARFIRTVSGKGNDSIISITAWFKQNKRSAQFEPYTGPVHFSSEGENKLTGFKNLTAGNFGKPLLSLYFTGGEISKSGSLTTAQLIAARNNNKPVLHLLAVHSGERLCREDADEVSGYFGDLCRFMNIPFKKTVIRDNDFNVKTVTKTVQALAPGSNDILVFTYSGHGFSYMEDEQNKFPQLALWHGDSPKRDFIRVNTINLEEVYNMLLAKKARLSIVTGDCCNSYIEMRRQHTEPTMPGVFGPRDKNWNHKAVSELFLETRQSYLMAAAQKGEVAASHRWYGGFFTFHFLEEINKKLLDRGSGKPAWVDIMHSIGKEAYDLSKQYACRHTVCGQHMISKTGK